jgi:circadian clock protein KaiC
LSETEEELCHGAASDNWEFPPSLEVLELDPPESLLDDE